ncbi:hypothetical protein [Candidatus Halobonum tyrrellensis]|uniref:hypothetical protein n=1 Tax=Candidatus Halobonum tyrrellensis TaxID=1431545 RepID=UPI001268A4D7|nr:hypothetical protein [Candidatus Halobonum tyrrellensis]
MPAGKDSEYSFFVYGEVELGEQYKSRVMGEKEGKYVAVTIGAELVLRVDEMGDGGGIAELPSGPVYLPGLETVGKWWRCKVSKVQEDRLVARATQVVPRRSRIKKGSVSDERDQSLNDLLNPKYTDS